MFDVIMFLVIVVDILCAPALQVTSLARAGSEGT